MRQELILEIIKDRWSPYAFSPQPVEEYKLKAMFEAAGYAPSSNNEQPWMFVYTTRDMPGTFNEYLDFLVEPNRIWAKNAYALIISLARTRFSSNNKLNRYAFHDTGMAVSNMLMQATSLDVSIHQMGGFSVEKVKAFFNLPDDIEPVAMMAAGYIGNGDNLSPELLLRDEKRRPRKPLKDYTFVNKPDEPAF